MGYWRKAGAVLVALALGGAAGGAGAAPMGFTEFYALGDSLSDDGNLFAATGGAAPAPPYWQGRFSNGPVWAEYVAADFAAAGRKTANFAYGGARVGPSPPPALSFGDQIDALAAATAGKLGKRPLASVWIGANDLFAGIAGGVARQAGRAAANGAAAGALELRDLGVNSVMLFNMPALNRTPAYTIINPAQAEQARIGTRTFNRTLARRADDLRGAGMTVIEINTFRLFNELLEDPAAYGLIDATTPCYVPGVVYCGDAVAPLLAFFDPVHPSSTVHPAIAEEVRARVAPVPLPAPAALLLVGIAGLGVAARRGRRRVARVRLGVSC